MKLGVVVFDRLLCASWGLVGGDWGGLFVKGDTTHSASRFRVVLWA